jgi:AraC-like DNA-binding protein
MAGGAHDSETDQEVGDVPPATQGGSTRGMTFSLGGDAGAGKNGFATWREVVSPVFVADPTPELDLHLFDVDFHCINVGPLILGTTRSVGQTFRRDTPTIARSGVDHLIVQTYVGGSTVVTTDVGEIEVGPGDVWLLDMTRTLSTTTSDQFLNVSMTIPRGLIEPLVADVDALHGVKLAGTSPLGGMLGQHLLGLEARAPAMNAREAAVLFDATVQLVAGCVGPTLEAREAVAGAMASALLARIRRSIDAHLGNPALGPDFLMQLHGLSRARLYRLFEPHGGVADYIRRRRLARCFLDLASPAEREVKVAAIGYRWGFGNEASFSRAFRSRFGLTPSDVRAGVRRPAPTTAPDAPVLEQWLRGLMER